MGKHAQERRFRYRLQTLLEEKDRLVMQFTGKSLFDLLLIIYGIPVFAEVKGRNTRYPEEQMDRQVEVCRKHGLRFVVLEQSENKGKIRVWTPMKDDSSVHLVEPDLAEWLEEE